MGLSSFLTGDTGESVVLDNYDHENSGRKVYLAMPNGEPSLSGYYDGYGNLNTDNGVVRVFDLLAKKNGFAGEDQADKLWLYSLENPRDFCLKFSYSEDAVYEDMEPSKLCPYQGLPPKVDVAFESLRQDGEGGKVFTVSGSLSALSNAVVQFEKMLFSEQGENTLFSENSAIVNGDGDNYYMEVRFQPETDDPHQQTPEEFFDLLDLSPWRVESKDLPKIFAGDSSNATFVLRPPMPEPFGSEAEKYTYFLTSRPNATTEMIHPGHYYSLDSVIKVNSARCHLIGGVKPTIEYDVSTIVDGFEMDITLQADLYTDLIAVYQNGKLEFEGSTVGDKYDNYLDNFLRFTTGVGSDPDLEYKNRPEPAPEPEPFEDEIVPDVHRPKP